MRYQHQAPANGCQHPTNHHLDPAPPADGACTLCTTTTSIVVPLNAIYINAAGQGSTVRARKCTQAAPATA